MGLLEAAEAVLAAWEADDEYEKNDLSEALWKAVGDLHRAVEDVKANKPVSEGGQD